MRHPESISRNMRHAAGEAFLMADPAAALTLVSITVFLDELTAALEGSESNNSFQSEILTDRLRAEGLDAWAQVAEDYLRFPKPTSDERFAALQILVGRAAGNFCGRRLDGAAADLIIRLRQVFHFETVDFVGAMEGVLASRPSGTDELIEFLQERARLAAIAPSKAAFGASRDLFELSPEPTGRRFREVWEGSFRRAIGWIYDALFYDVLRRMDPHSYLELLETYPLDEGIYVLLEAADREASRDELVSLLTIARPVFDASGIWTQANRAAFILLDLLGERLFKEKCENGQPVSDSALGLANTVDALTGRPDGVPLAYAWLQRLMTSHGKSRRPFRTYEDVDATPILAHITNAVARRFPDLPQPIKWVEEEEEFWRKERVYVLIAIGVSRPTVDKTKLMTLLESVLLKDLVGSFGLDRLLASQASFDSLIVGNAIMLINDPATWFDGLWRRLFWQRDRARSHRHISRDLPNTGQVICTWTALSLAYFPPASEEAARLWASLEIAVRESSLMDWFRQPPNDIWCMLLRYLGAIWSRIFPDDPAAGERGSLDDFLSSWLHVDANLVLLAVAIRKYGVSPMRLSQAGVSAELLRRSVQDSNLCGHSLLAKPDADLALDLAKEIDDITIE